MADKIKAFFQKKKKNGKFLNAGRGYKLTESSTSETTAIVREPIKRAEPTEEAKVAGQAALARFEAKKNDTRRFNTSYAAIQARVKRELEMERNAQQNALEKKETNRKENTKEYIENNPALAVTGVFFRCSYLSDEILSRDEWRKKIREFLYEELKGEEPGLIACLIIQNCNTGKDKREACVEVLCKYLENIINNPTVEKYQKIRMSNRIFQEKVLQIEGAQEFLKAAGFQQKKLLHNEEEEDFLVWDSENSSIENITVLSEALRCAECIPLEVDRNLKVLLPQAASEKCELPPSFFMPHPEEIKREQQLRSESVERFQMLRTKAMREKDEQRESRKYRFSLIRIKFPDNIILQGTFAVHEKFQNVIDFVRENLANSDTPFLLISFTGEELNQDFFDKTLLELKLVPAVILSFSLETTDASTPERSTGYLKEELLYFVENA